MVELERLGVVRRVFRTLTINGQTVPNILFLELDADALERLTFPEEYGTKNEMGEKGMPEDRPVILPECSLEEVCGGYHLNRGPLPPESGRGITQIGDTSHQSEGDGPAEIGETNTENTYRDYHTDCPIQSYQQVKEAFKKQIEYDILIRDRTDGKELDELVEIATEVLTSTAGTIRVNREGRPAELVKEQYRKLNMFHIQYVLNCLQETETKARNIRAVMITAMYNAVNTIGVYYGNLYQSHNAQKNHTDTGG